MARRPKILYAGTYERLYPRNQQFIRLLHECGCDVTEVHVPFWENFRDKSHGFGGLFHCSILAIRLAHTYVRLLVRVLMQLRRSDLVVIGYIGQLDMLVLGSVARLFRIRVLFNPLVTLTDTVVEDRGLAPGSSLVGRLIWCIDWLALRMASLTVTDTEENARYLEERFGILRSRIRSLHVGADESLFRERPARAKEEAGLHVLFYGKMIPLHGIETILDAIARIHEDGDADISFEIIGSGQDDALVTSFITSHPEIDLAYRPWVAYQRLPQRIATADVVLGIFGAGEKSSRVVPNKVFQAMAVGRPIVTRDSAAIRSVLADGESALLVRPADGEAVACAIRKLRDSELRTRLSIGSRAAFERFGSDEAVSGQLQNIVEALLARSTPDIELAGRTR